MILMNDQIKYIDDLIHSMIRGVKVECLLYNGSLYVIADDTIFFYTNLSNKYDPSILYGYTLLGSEKSSLSRDEINFLINKYNELTSYENIQNHIYEDPNLRSNEEFNNLTTGLKAGDGAKFYFMNARDCTPFIPVASGLPILNQKDTLSIDLYNMGNHHILVKMKVYKKKYNLYYDMYYKILDVNRPIR